jgi:hypothetical protein
MVDDGLSGVSMDPMEIAVSGSEIQPVRRDHVLHRRIASTTRNSFKRIFPFQWCKTVRVELGGYQQTSFLEIDTLANLKTLF